MIMWSRKKNCLETPQGHEAVHVILLLLYLEALHDMVGGNITRTEIFQEYNAISQYHCHSIEVVFSQMLQINSVKLFGNE